MMMSDLGSTSYILMIAIWLVIMGFGIWLLATLFPSTSHKPADLPDEQKSDSVGSAVQILKQRYARGEISKEQYEEMRRALDA